tara:strand:- start:238 stop:462 length:225 start_codon:yes stop_codon:yes gene_type:complete
MFNKKGESQMEEENNKVFLVIKKTYWDHDGETWFDVAEHSKSRARAENCINALNTLNKKTNISYLICEVANDNK